MRHIEALELGNFHLFPGETYTIGFLRSYAFYLGLDTEKIIQHYKNEMMVNIDTPIKELTQASVKPIDYFVNYLKYVVLAGVVILISVFVLDYFDVSPKNLVVKEDEKTFNAEFSIEDYLKESGKVPNEKTESVNFTNGILFALVKIGEGIDFPLKNNEVYIVLKKLHYKTVENENNKVELEIYPGKQKVELSEAVPALLHFPWLARKIKLNLLGATPHNIKIKVTQLGSNEQYNEEYNAQKSDQADSEQERLKPENFTINLIVRTTAENYVEFYIDGEQKKRGLLPVGEVLHFKANDSIQMKIGDAGSIEVVVNGKPLKKGKKGQQINKIIRKVRDPVEQLKFRLEIKDT